MQDLTAPVLAGFGCALVVLGVYHLLVAGPRFNVATTTLATHDGLLGGGGAAPATRRIDALEVSTTTAGRDIGALTQRIAALERVAQSETPRVGFVRYNAFDDVGSDQSYALALLTRDGDGVVLSSIYSREETRTYGKGVLKFQTAQEASAEELTAIAKARAATT